MEQFVIKGKKVTIYPSEGPNCPIIYLNNFAEDGNKVYDNLMARHNYDFTLVNIAKLDWNHDMSPWNIPALSKLDTPCTAGADDYLQLMIDEIIPCVEDKRELKPSWRGLVGYSLAGLFAIYSMYKTDMFARFASMSGSLWAPNLIHFINDNEIVATPECLYFSLGDKESKTRNKLLRTVQDNTQTIFEYFKAQKIDTIFELNHGNHYIN